MGGPSLHGKQPAKQWKQQFCNKTKAPTRPGLPPTQPGQGLGVTKTTWRRRDERTADIDKKQFSVTLPIVFTVLGAVGCAILVYTGDRGQIYKNAEDIVELQASAEKCAEDFQTNKIESTELRSDVKHIKETVDELREHFIKWNK